MKEISGYELRTMLEQDQNLALIEVLNEEEFKQFHIPKAKNIPLSDSFEQEVQDQIPDKHQNVVVYCKNKECSASEKAAERLDRLGYENVFDYKAGKEDWEDQGYAIAM